MWYLKVGEDYSFDVVIDAIECFATVNKPLMLWTDKHNKHLLLPAHRHTEKNRYKCNFVNKVIDYQNT